MDFPLKVGEKILRPVVKGKLMPRVLNIKFAPNKLGQVLIKVKKWQTANDQWVGLAGQTPGGLVCFCSSQVPEGWTHFEVTSIGMKGKCAFVKPIEGPVLELIKEFKV